ncbi:hypothetical protein FB567DRAFT_277461 [Paraphoma chrysanthemicola]|uniref:MYND-type domain-containing protein n=1 Tax=Paraphoma chrysanthemicola TaxID=798071 RepID=A0A8K0RCC2_9PLEO|nr:hypothetical protein FB567DRAFT_277461 [Paraphoma chrysanthemicola]
MANTPSKPTNASSPGVEVTKQCANCGKADGLACSRCMDHYFCDKSCMKIAWPEHKEVCAKDPIEKAVRRAGSVLQRLFLTARERASADKIFDIRWNGSDDRLEISFTCTIGEFHRFSRAPHLSDRDVIMALTAGQCWGAVAWYADVLMTLLKGTAVVIEEVNLELRLPAKWARRLEVGNDKEISHHTSHHVFRVSSTKDSRRWYIYITGAQFGQFVAVMEAAKYMQSHGALIRSITPLGTSKAHMFAENTYFHSANQVRSIVCAVPHVTIIAMLLFSLGPSKGSLSLVWK